MRASNYRATDGEANFGKPITAQVVGGTHITCELVTKSGQTFYVTEWPRGLPRHDDPPNSVRFPHGLIRFGESLQDCAKRLVNDQLGMLAQHVKVLYIDSYVDDKNHWHIEPGCLVEVSGTPTVPREASRITEFDVSAVPDLTFWERAEFLDTIRQAEPQLFGGSTQ